MRRALSCFLVLGLFLTGACTHKPSTEADLAIAALNEPKPDLPLADENADEKASKDESAVKEQLGESAMLSAEASIESRAHHKSKKAKHAKKKAIAKKKSGKKKHH